MWSDPTLVSYLIVALLFFHGGPYRQMLLGPNPMGAYTYMYAENQYFASRGYVVLSVNYRGGTGYGEFKKQLFAKIREFFAPMRARRAEILAKPHYIDDVLADGAKRANAIADVVMERVRDAVGLR